jgi:subtilisin-like proprotein convertase family protein
MKHFALKTIALLMCIFCYQFVFAQIVTFNGTGGLPIPPGAPIITSGITESPCTVSGIGIIGGCVTIENVQIDMTHTFVGDLGIFLIGPSGQVLELVTNVGGGGDNFSNTIFTDNSGVFINSGTPPFIGSYRPEGRVTSITPPYSNAPALGTHTFANTYNGTNADGTWILHINDLLAADIGELISWSISFNLNGTAPTANAGPDTDACVGQSTLLTATGGATYLWSTGETTSTISVSPSATTTYSVTVTAGSCGSDTDDVVVTVQPAPTVVFTATNPDLCQTGCKQVTATFTGTPPFTLNYLIIESDGTQTPASLVSNGFTQTFDVCAPPNTPVGSLQVQATSVVDDNCTCN